jgi:DnaJ-class molecular chaperone
VGSAGQHPLDPVFKEKEVLLENFEMFKQICETNELLDTIDEPCPNCKGKGELPIFQLCDYIYTKEKCHLCNGTGYLRRKIKE